MSTTTETPTLVMTAEYAYAIRVELEAVARILEPFDEAAGRAGDIDVLALVARTQEAIQAAAKIQATRQRPPLPRRARHARKGVSLIKS